MTTTGIFTGWVLIYKDNKVIVADYLENQEATSIHSLETFASEEAMNTRIAELGLTINNNNEEGESE